jgi:hypothetical protein
MKLNVITFDFTVESVNSVSIQFRWEYLIL